jgi:hypothetical protein
MSCVVELADHRTQRSAFALRTYRPEFLLFEGYKRRQWCVIERKPDGSESYISVAGGRKREAEYAAGLWTKVEQRRQRDLAAVNADPLGRSLLSMPADERETMRRLLNAIARLLDD